MEITSDLSENISDVTKSEGNDFSKYFTTAPIKTRQDLVQAVHRTRIVRTAFLAVESHFETRILSLSICISEYTRARQ